MRAHTAAHAVGRSFGAAPGSRGERCSEGLGDQAASSPAPGAPAWHVIVAQKATVPAGVVGAAEGGGGATGRSAGITKQSAGGAERFPFPNAQANAQAQAQMQGVAARGLRSEQPQLQLPVLPGRSEPRSPAPSLDLQGGPECASGASTHAQATAATSAGARGAGDAAPGSGAALHPERGDAALGGAGQPGMEVECSHWCGQGGEPGRVPGGWLGAAGSLHEGSARGGEPARSEPGQAPGGRQGAAVGGAADGRRAQYEAMVAALRARVPPIGISGDRGAPCCRLAARSLWHEQGHEFTPVTERHVCPPMARAWKCVEMC